MIVIIIKKVAYIAFYNFPLFWRTFLAELEELDDDPVDVASHFVSKVNIWVIGTTVGQLCKKITKIKNPKEINTVRHL